LLGRRGVSVTHKAKKKTEPGRLATPSIHRKTTVRAGQKKRCARMLAGAMTAPVGVTNEKKREIINHLKKKKWHTFKKP